MMANRRDFLKASVAAVAASRTVLGANDRVRMGLIGCGTRGNMVSGFFLRHKDCEFVAAAEVVKSKLDQTAAKLEESGSKVERFGDYRRLLERKDIDAVLIATPDHWHSPMTVE